VAVPVADVIHNKEIRKGGGEWQRGDIFAISRYTCVSLTLSQFSY